jgi:hypothetical protein
MPSSGSGSSVGDVMLRDLLLAGDLLALAGDGDLNVLADGEAQTLLAGDADGDLLVLPGVLHPLAVCNGIWNTGLSSGMSKWVGDGKLSSI